jgi:MoaA/NifB/PqqE/SkfB family radical SAM enzyme
MRLIKGPILCNYYLTYRCNAKCGFCDIWERPSGYVDMETYRHNLQDLKKLGVKVIDFTGGEPLLHQELPQFLTLAKDMGFITTVTTNGLLYPKNAPKLSGLVDMLHFSLDSADEQEHDKMRGVACFSMVMESIRIAQSLGERPDIIFTVFGHNIEQIEKVYHDIILPNNLVLILNPAFEYNDLGVDEDLSEQVLDQLTWWGKQKNVYLNDAFIALRKDGGNHVARPGCKAGSASIVISPDNKLITPCYHLGEEELPIENNLYELYHSDKAQQSIALEGRLPACEGCTINCYMQPSFAVEMNKYWWKALPSTMKYNRMKGTWKQLIK